MRTQRALFCLMGTTFIMCGTGCNPVSMATSGYKAVKGANAHVYSIEAPQQADLTGFESLKFTDVTTDVSAVCPIDVLMAVRSGMQEVLANEETKKVFPGGGKSLTLDVTCRFYKQKPTIGKEGRLDLLVTLVTPEGRVLGRVYVEGINESMRETKPEAMAKKNTEKLVEYLKKIKMPKESGK